MHGTAIRHNTARRAIRTVAACAMLAVTATAQVSVDYLTFPGGGTGEVAVDDSGCLYVVGGRGGAPVIPAGSPCGTGPAVSAVWLAKLDASGEILWSRRLEGAPYTIAVDRAGARVYVGSRYSSPPSQFPAFGYDPTVDGGADGFVACFDGTTGCPITYTFFGDHNNEGVVTPHGIAVDDATGNVHVVGMTGATEFVTTATLEGFVPPGQSWEAFVVGFDASLTMRRYFVYLPGGSGFENAQDVAVDATGIYVAGASDSTDLSFAPQRIGPGGGQDAFVMKLDPTASSLLYATFVGGSRDECAQGANQVAFQKQGAWVAVDGLGRATVTSWTESNDFPTTDGTSSLRRDDVFVTKLSASGSGPVYSTLVGGNQIDVSAGIGRDDATGHVYVAGTTGSNEFPTPGGVVTQHNGGDDAFVIELDDETGALLAGTFLGGSADDDAWGGLAAGAPGSVYVSGRRSDGFLPPPTSTTYAESAYVAKLHFGPVPPTPGITVSPTAGLQTSESGGTDAFTVVLDTQPSAAVTVDVWTSDATEGLVSAGAQGPAMAVTLTFDAATWSQPQTVTVHGQDDALLDGDVAYTLVTDPAVSADFDYAGVDAADVSATNLDNEVPAGVSVTSIAPSSMSSGTSIGVTIGGAGFQTGATVSLEGGAGPSPAVSGVAVVSGSTITATLTDGGGGPKGTRTWDVRVTNPGGSTGVLAGGFQVVK